MEIRSIPIVDQLLRRGRYVSATIQYYTGTEIHLVHVSVVEENLFRTLENHQKGAHEDDKGNHCLFASLTYFNEY